MLLIRKIKAFDPKRVIRETADVMWLLFWLVVSEVLVAALATFCICGSVRMASFLPLNLLLKMTYFGLMYPVRGKPRVE